MRISKQRFSPSVSDDRDAFSAPAITVQNLVKSFGSVIAVNNLSLTVASGQIFGILGPNGSGKTTTINIISGLSEPSSGSVAIFGMDPRKQSIAVRRALGVVPQETALYEELTAERNLAFHAELFGYSGHEKRQKIIAALELAQLVDRASSRVGTFSGGMKRRLAIARALLHEPQLIYLDEPTLGVDVQSRNVIWEYIRKIKTEGRTVLLTTNYLEEANALCDHIAIIDHGKLMALDTPSGLKERYGNSVVEMELSSPVDDETVQSVSSLLSIQNVEVRDTTLRITLNGASGATAGSLVPRLLGLLEGRGFTVHHLNLREPSLDEVFLALTGKGVRD